MAESWYPDNYYTTPKPHYKTMPDFLRLEDLFSLTLEPDAQHFWRKQRNVALEQWKPAINIKIREQPFGFGYRRHRVTLDVQQNVNDLGGLACFGCDPFTGDECRPCAKRGIGWIKVDTDVWTQAWTARNGTYLRYIIAHEFGHTLGFQHGGTGIMDATPYHAQVNAEEIQAAKAYWGT